MRTAIGSSRRLIGSMRSTDNCFAMPARPSARRSASQVEISKRLRKPLNPRHCEKRSDDAIQRLLAQSWLALRVRRPVEQYPVIQMTRYLWMLSDRGRGWTDLPHGDR